MTGMTDMNYNAFFNSLGLETPPECFEGTFLRALEEYRKDGVFFLSSEYIEYVNSFESCISNCIDDVKRAAKKILQREALAVYALFLYRAMLQRKTFMEHIKEFEFPEGSEAELDFLPFAVIITAIPELYQNLKKRGVQQDIIAQTLRQFEDCVYLTEERTGRPGFLKRYFVHMQKYVDEKILNIGRLRFEMVPELESNVSVLENRNGELAVLFDGAGSIPPVCFWAHRLPVKMQKAHTPLLWKRKMAFWDAAWTAWETARRSLRNIRKGSGIFC